MPPMKVGVWIGAAAMTAIAAILGVWQVNEGNRRAEIDSQISQLMVRCTLEMNGDPFSRRPNCDRIDQLKASR